MELMTTPTLSTFVLEVSTSFTLVIIFKNYILKMIVEINSYKLSTYL